MKKWKYKAILRIQSDALNDYEMNSYGYDGWELVSVSVTGTKLLYYFKKEIE